MLLLVSSRCEILKFSLFPGLLFRMNIFCALQFQMYSFFPYEATNNPPYIPFQRTKAENTVLCIIKKVTTLRVC